MESIPAKVQRVLERGGDFVPPAIDASLYLDLAESVTRQAARWQEPDGMIGDPYNEKGVESVTATARFCAAAGHLLRAGRCRDLLAAAMLALDWSCAQLTAHVAGSEPWPYANFNTKDILVLYEALLPFAPAERLAAWRDALAGPSPEALYFGERNWLFYGTAAEALRIRLGLSGRRDWIDRALQTEMEWWTDEGMYRDPGDPTTYDLTVRQGLAMMLESGYDGEHAGWARGVLRKGALATLLFVSPCGVAPFGGRSNQLHHMEGMIAYLAEWQAKEEARAGNARLAGALRRMALAGAEASRRWLLREPYFSLKNRMAEYPGFGQDGFPEGQSAHSGYGLLAGNLFAGAYHIADPTIPAGAMPGDIGGCFLYLPDAFHRVWATAGDYHVQIDTRGQPGYDATGLGRFHRRGAPIEAGMNIGIVPAPHYRMPLQPAPRAVALGVGWPAGEDWRYLAEADRDTHEVEVTDRCMGDTVGFRIAYVARGGGLGGPALVHEDYSLSAGGLRCAVEVPGAPRVRLQVPVIETDGECRSEICVERAMVEGQYGGWAYRVFIEGSVARSSLEEWPAPNRNGIYRVAVFEVEGPRVAYRVVLEQG